MMKNPLFPPLSASRPLPLLAAILAALALSAAVPAARAAEGIQISEARLMAPIPGQKVSAAYLRLTNASGRDMQLVGVESAHAERIELHSYANRDGLMRMVRLDSLPLAAGEVLTFRPGGNHLMVFAPDIAAIQSGQFAMTFQFADGATLETDLPVAQPGKSRKKSDKKSDK